MILKNGKRLDGCSDTLPIGTIQPFLGLTPPNGYLACLGQLISKAEYPELYLICGDLFGQSTETHFYLPDLRGKTIVGYDESDTLLNVMGKILGSKTHKHSVAGHTHDIDGHTHTSAAHTHDVAGHTHTSAAHTHSVASHSHTSAAHTHGPGGMTACIGAPTGNSFGLGYVAVNPAGDNSSYSVGGTTATATGHPGRSHNTALHGNVETVTPGNTGGTSLTTNSTTPGATGSTSLTTKSTTPGATGSTSLTTKSSGDSNTGDADNFQPSIAMNWIVKAAMLIPEYFRVENILSSSSTSNALSAAQGKVLFDKIENNATYNLEEQVVGTWIDGKPLYRLVIKYTANPDNNYYAVMNNGAVSTIIMGIESIARLDTFIENGTVMVPLPSNGDYECRVYIQRSYGGFGVIATASSVENFKEKQITAILEYTKITD